MLLAKLFATCVGKDGRGAEMLAMVARGLELMQSNAEQLISLALCSGPTFSFPECLDDSLILFYFILFTGRSGFGQSQRSGAWPSAARDQLAVTHGHCILLGRLPCVPHCK